MKSSVIELQSLCDICDIVVLQELWLMDFETQFLTTLHDKFYAKGISFMDSSVQVLNGRPHGGLGILWRKSLGESCTILEFDDARLLSIELIINENSPCECLLAI